MGGMGGTYDVLLGVDDGVFEEGLFGGEAGLAG